MRENMKYILVMLSLLFIGQVHAKDCDVFVMNECLSCYEPNAFLIASEEACSGLCSNRKANHYGYGSEYLPNWCALKKCPPDFPYRSGNGSCLSAPEDTKAEVERANAYFESHYVPNPKAENGKCPDNFPILSYGKCYSCDDLDEISASKAECDKCPNRKYAYYAKWGVEGCFIPCPKDKPLQSYSGECYSCDENKVIYLPVHCNIEHDCEDWCPNRTILYSLGGNIPSLPNCPPNRPVMDSEGVCYPKDKKYDLGPSYRKLYLDND